MAKFERSFPLELQEKLNKTDLYQNCLLPNIKSGEVFPAFRKNKIHFYHKGGRLFEFDGKKFTTHVKYASVLQGYEKAYIEEKSLLDADVMRFKQNFEQGYEGIKKNCALYSGLEASGVAEIYEKSSYLKAGQDVFVLDIEVSLKSLNKEEEWNDELPNDGKKGTQDRLDLLLFNKAERCLQFFEAKHFGNQELWSRAGSQPKVISQIQRYNEQLKTRNEEILQAYKDYAHTVRELFGLSEESMPNPVSLEKDVVLLVFGFDSLQKEKLKELLIEDGSLNGIRYRFIGKPENAEQMWKNRKLGK